MSNTSFPGAHVDPTAVIGEGTSIGAGSIIGPRATLGAGCQVGCQVVVHEEVRIGALVRIDDHASLGKQPMRAPNSAVTADRVQPPTVVGDRCLVGTGAVIYAGAVLEDRVLVADLATIREDVQVGRGTIVGRGVAIENKCSIGRWCKLETNAYITAYSTLEDRVFVAPGVLTSNDNFIGRTAERFANFAGITVRRGGRLGVGAVILPGRTIGEDAVVAAGAVLTRDAEPGMIYAGVPARAIRAVPHEQTLDEQGWNDD